MDTSEIPEESAEELYEDAPCGYLSCADDGTVQRINGTLLAWLGYTRAEVVGRRSFTSFLTLPGRVFHETNLAPLLHVQGFANAIALDLLCKDGERLPALLNCKKVQNAAGAEWLRISVFDASDRRRYERELLLERRRAEQAAQAKAEFLATVSHEIRNHLHSISAVAQLMALGSDTAQHDRHVELLSAASSSLLNLVDDILDYSKMEAGKLALDERPINVRDVVQGVAAGVRARAELRELALLVEVDERVPQLVVADPIKLAQVLTNLCTNAIKFTARGWIKLWVSVEARDPACEHSGHGVETGKTRLHLGVKDSGVGIPAGDLPALCEAFTHVSKEGSARVRSTGLGLSICKRILGLYQSQLLVESVEGAGSNFHFELSLPIAELPAARHMLRDLTRAQTLRGVRVLVAAPADTAGALNAQLVTRLLERWGADFDLVDSGAKALEQVKQHQYDLVLMDTELEAGSTKTTRAIRELASDEPAPLPIIALGPNSAPGQHERLAAQGFTDFVDEPLESELLFRSIAHHASLHRALLGETEPGGRRWTPGRC